MAQLNFPLQIRFKLLALAPQIFVNDVSGRTVLYVKQKMFKLKESVKVFSDESQSQALYEMNADRIIDFSATYNITDASGRKIGACSRAGMKSIWRTSYSIADAAGNEIFTIREENAWIKVLDGLLGSVAILNLFTGYFLHPAYLISRPDGFVVMRVKKQAAFFEGKFAVDQHTDLSERDQTLCMLSSMMMLLLERSRG